MPQRQARLEIVPMIDIMMFLLVFFVMITLSMIPNAGLPIEHPRSASTHDGARHEPDHDRPGSSDGHAHIDGRRGVVGPTQGATCRRSMGFTRSVVIMADRVVGFQASD